MIHALVPVKPLEAAKSRLAAVLSPAERRDLVLAMLGDVLGALSAAPQVAGVTVISRDPSALALAAEYGAQPMVDAAGSLNGALAQGAAHLVAAGASALLALPADLPLVTPADIAQLAGSLRCAPSVALAAARDGGTNALLASPPDALPFLFGASSLREHLAAARERGVAARLVHAPGLELDVDRPDDLLVLACASGAGAAQRLARRLNIIARDACA